MSSDSKSGHLQTPAIIPNELNENGPIQESLSPPSAPLIRAVYNSVAEGPSRRPTSLDSSPVRQTGKRSPSAWRHGRPWVDYNRDASAEANPNSPEALLVQTQNTVDKTGDYEGVVMKSKPVKNKNYLTENNLPWAFNFADVSALEESREVNVPVMERLEVEMMRFHEYIKPSRTEALARRQLVEQVRSHVREVIPDAALEVFGSERTGLAFATSDIDLRLLKFTDMEESASSVLPPSKQQRIRLLDDIYRLFRHLRKNSQYEHCVVLHARYPLVSLRDKASGLDVQIVLSNDTSLSRAMIRKYIEEYPFIRPVYSVVKTMFDIRGLSDTFRGGFGSYSIFMMIVASFRHCDWKTPPTSAGEGLKAFIDFWTVFDTTKNGISLEPTELYDKAIDAPMTDTVRAKLQNKEIQPAPDFCLSLRDPADKTNDLGRKGIAIKHLQATLIHSVRKEFYKRLLRNKDPSLLHPLITPVYGLTINERKKLRVQGLNVSKNMDSRLADKVKQIREASTSADSASSKPVISSEPLQAAGVDYESFSNVGDALTSTLGMPSAEEWANKSESNPQGIMYSEAPTGLAETKQTVLERGVRIEYVAVPPLSEQAVKVSEDFWQAKEKLMRKGIQLPSITHMDQEFRSKAASESQRNYESKKRKHEKARVRFEEAREKMRKDAIAETTVELREANAKLEATAEGPTTGPPEVPSEQGETSVEEFVEAIPVEALDPTPVEVTETTAVETADVEPQPSKLMEMKPEEASQPTSESPVETKAEETVQATIGATAEETKLETAEEKKLDEADEASKSVVGSAMSFFGLGKK